MKKLTTILFSLALFTGTSFAQNNDATVSQSGNDHLVSIDQVGTTNEAVVNQSGNTNMADLDQASNSSGPSVAYITQTRNGNISMLNQEGFSSATISQTNVGSKVWGYLNPSGAATQYSEGDLNTLTVTQNGPFSRLYVDQTAGGNSASISQGVNNSNVAWIFQNSEGNSIMLNQMGGVNHSTILQYDDGSHTVLADQIGKLHRSTIEQNGFDNMVDLTQSGESHISNVTQTGMNNSATVTQSN